MDQQFICEYSPPFQHVRIDDSECIPSLLIGIDRVLFSLISLFLKSSARLALQKVFNGEESNLQPHKLDLLFEMIGQTDFTSQL